MAAVLEPGQQTRQFLDAVSPDNPVFLYDESHHSVWVNTKALEVAGIHRDTPNPEGGIIERDRDGDPTGLLRETANAMVASVIPPASDAQKPMAAIDIRKAVGDERMKRWVPIRDALETVPGSPPARTGRWCPWSTRGSRSRRW